VRPGGFLWDLGGEATQEERRKTTRLSYCGESVGPDSCASVDRVALPRRLGGPSQGNPSGGE
jgi:hypothetical protein